MEPLLPASSPNGIPTPLIRHLTGEYLNLSDAFTPGDLLYWAAKQKRRTFTKEQLLKQVDEPRHGQTLASLVYLINQGKLVFNPETENYTLS